LVLSNAIWVQIDSKEQVKDQESYFQFLKYQENDKEVSEKRRCEKMQVEPDCSDHKYQLETEKYDKQDIGSRIICRST